MTQIKTGGVHFFYSTINHQPQKKVHAAQSISRMRGCSTSWLQHSFRLANVCQMFCACGDTRRALLPLMVIVSTVGGSGRFPFVHTHSCMMGKCPKNQFWNGLFPFVWLCLVFGLWLQLVSSAVRELLFLSYGISCSGCWSFSTAVTLLQEGEKRKTLLWQIPVPIRCV